MNAMPIHVGMKTMSIEELKKRKIIFIIWGGDEDDKALLIDIKRKSHALNIEWSMMWSEASDGMLLTLLKKDALAPDAMEELAAMGLSFKKN